MTNRHLLGLPPYSFSTALANSSQVWKKVILPAIYQSWPQFNKIKCYEAECKSENLPSLIGIITSCHY